MNHRNVAIALCFLAIAVTGRASAESLTRSGTMTLWTSKPCALPSGGLCGIPQAIAAPWKAEIAFDRPNGIGRFEVADSTFEVGTHRVRYRQFWSIDSRPADSYVMTQVELYGVSSDAVALIALCTRYDALDAFAILPPGACAGAEGDSVVGVSVSR